MAFHVELMKAHGLIDASTTLPDGNGYIRGTIRALTWDGYDYLEAIRSDAVWTRTKKAIAGTVGSTTIDVIKQVATRASLDMVLAAL